MTNGAARRARAIRAIGRRTIIDPSKSINSLPPKMLAGAQQEGIQMRNLAAAACALIGAFAVSPLIAEAQNYRPWCAPNQFGGVMCSFDTKEQCMEPSAGVAAACAGKIQRLGRLICRRQLPPSRPQQPNAQMTGTAPGVPPTKMERLLALSNPRTNACDRSVAQGLVAAGQIPRRAQRPASLARRRRPVRARRLKDQVVA